MKKFWDFLKDDAGKNILQLDTPIESADVWLDGNGTAKIFQSELASCDGDITVQINSPGGDVFAATTIYHALKKFPHKVKVEIISLAASAASIVAMAGDVVSINPAGMLMIHNPVTMAIGDSEEMRAAVTMLDEVKETIINAYELKTGLSRKKIADMMTAETWMNAKKALELKFVDEILFADATPAIQNSFMFSRQTVINSLMQTFKNATPKYRDATPYFKWLNAKGYGGEDYSIGGKKRIHLGV